MSRMFHARLIRQTYLRDPIRLDDDSGGERCSLPAEGDGRALCEEGCQSAVVWKQTFLSSLASAEGPKHLINAITQQIWTQLAASKSEIKANFSRKAWAVIYVAGSSNVHRFLLASPDSGLTHLAWQDTLNRLKKRIVKAGQ